MRTISGLTIVLASILGVTSAGIADPPAGAGNRENAGGRGRRETPVRLPDGRLIPMPARIQPNSGRLSPTSGSSSAAGDRPIGPQFGTGRVGRESISAGASARFEARSSANAGTRRDEHAPNDRANSSSQRPETVPGDNQRRLDVPDFDATARADRLLRQHIAAADRLRDLYAETGNTRLLQRADELEEIARVRYQRRLELLSQSREEVAGTRASSGAEFGQTTSLEARSQRGEFGMNTSTRARADGRAFGNAIIPVAGERDAETGPAFPDLPPSVPEPPLSPPATEEGPFFPAPPSSPSDSESSSEANESTDSTPNEPAE